MSKSMVRGWYEKKEWLLCPICKSKTRIKLRKDTELKNFLMSG